LWVALRVGFDVGFLREAERQFIGNVHEDP
jgi:hypothetical protein